MIKFGSASRNLLTRSLIVLLMISMIFGGVSQVKPVLASGTPVPEVTLNIPTSGFIGEPISIKATFDNNCTGDNTGYGPYIDLIIPQRGVDGVYNGSIWTSPADGLSFVGASYLGVALPAAQIKTYTFGSSLLIAHPFAKTNTGAAVVINGAAAPFAGKVNVGDQLVVLQLPFGSFTCDQTPAEIDVDLNLSNMADLSSALAISARAGFIYGNDPLANPTTDPSIIQSGLVSSNFTPTVIKVTKTYIGPENETATGPNYPRQYKIMVDVATGQTVTNLDVTDFLPDDQQFLQVDSVIKQGTDITATAGVISTPTASPYPAVPTPGGTLTRRVTTVTGNASANDVEMTYTYYVPAQDALSSDTVTTATGAKHTYYNKAQGSGSWVPIDGRDSSTTVSGQTGFSNEHPVEDKALAIQKGVAIVNDTGPVGATPGDTLEYTLDFQVSDYFALQNVQVLYDNLSDGQIFDNSFTPTLWFSENGSTVNEPFLVANYNVAARNGTTGVIQVSFNVSQQLIDAPGARSGQMIGGLVADNYGGGNDGATRGIIKFRTTILDAYQVIYPSGNASLNQGDAISNTVNIQGDLLQANTCGTGTCTPYGGPVVVPDGSAAGVNIAQGVLQKKIYAINGLTGFTVPPKMAPFDSITYRIQYDFVIGDHETFKLRDFLPLPVFYANDPDANGSAGPAWSFDSVNAIPSVGKWKYGPADSYFSRRSIVTPGFDATVPALSADAPSNSMTFDFGTYDDPTNTALKLDLLFTVKASDKPFADGLFLTNQVTQTDQNTQVTPDATNQIIQIELTEPVLNIKKGVVASSHNTATYSPALTGQPSFSLLGSDCNTVPFSSTITSTMLASNPINSNISGGLDAGDTVTFVTTVENTGSGIRGAFNVQLTEPDISSWGTIGTTCVWNGSRQAINYTGSLTDTTNGITFDDPSVDQGALYAPTTPEDGKNIAFVVYNVTLKTAVEPSKTYTNTVNLQRYTGSDNADASVNFVNGTPDETDTASVATGAPAAVKTLIAHDNSDTDTTHVAVGEIVTYQVVVTVPEGTSNSVTLVDNLASGRLAYVQNTCSISTSAALSSSRTFGNVCANLNSGTNGSSVGANGAPVTLDFGTVTNTDTTDGTAETITVQYQAVVVNVAGNSSGATDTNTASWNWNNGSAQNVNGSYTVTVVEPVMSINKTALPTTGDAGDTIQFSIAVSNNTAAVAYNVNLSDVIPSGMTYVGGTVSGSGANAPDSAPSYDGVNNKIVATWSTFPKSGSYTITFNVTLDTSVEPRKVYTNTSNLEWTSMPGDLTTARSTYSTVSTERTGNTGNPGGSENDYRTSDPATVTMNAPSVVKTIIAHDNSDTDITHATVGEVLTYRLTVTVPEGTSNSVTLVDNLASGRLAYVQNTCSISNSAALSSSRTFGNVCANLNSSTNGSSVGANGAPVTFDFGTVTNTDTTNGNAETITVEYQAVVLNTNANISGATDTNTATWNWNNGSAQNVTGTYTVTIVEPSLSINKIASPTTGDAGDNIQFSVQITSTAAAVAYEVDLSDVIPAGMTYVAASVGGSGANPPTSGPSYDGGNNKIVASWTSFPKNGSYTVTFNVTLDTSVKPRQVLSNTAGIVWTSMPGVFNNSNKRSTYYTKSVERGGDTSYNAGDINNYNATDPATVTINDPLTTKTIVAHTNSYTDLTHVAVGEVITYQVQYTAREGTSLTLKLVDTLDAGLALVNNSCVITSNNNSDLSSSNATAATDDTKWVPICTAATAGASGITLDFGTLTNTNTNEGASEVITIQYQAVVTNVASNATGQVLRNSAVWSWNDGTTNRSLTAVRVTTTVVEPYMTIDKTTTFTSGDAGNTVPLKVVVSNTSGTNHSDGHNVEVIDNLTTPKMTYSGNLTVGSCTGPATSGLSSNVDGTNKIITVGWVYFPVGASCTITFDATLDGNVVPGETLTNTAAMTWTSMPGTLNSSQTSYSTVGVERTGTPADNAGGAQNDHNASDPASVTIDPPTTSKTIFAHSNSYTDISHAAIGEVLTYHVDYTAREGTTTQLKLVDTLDAGLALVDGSCVITSTNNTELSSSNGTAATDNTKWVPICTAATMGAGGITLDFGTLTNTNSNNGVSEVITIEYKAVVLNTAANARGQTRGNSAVWSWFNGTVTQSLAAARVSVTLVEPTMTIDKSTSFTTGDAGDVVPFSVVVSGSSAANYSDGHNVQFIDNLTTPKMTYVPSSLSVGSCTGPATSGLTTNVDGTNKIITVGWDYFPVGASCTVTFNATLDVSVISGETLTNTGNLSWTSMPGDLTTAQSTYSTVSTERTGNTGNPGGAENDHRASDPASVSIGQPSTTKSLFDHSNSYTDLTHAAVGEILTYHLQYTAREGTTTSVNIVDTLDAGLALVNGSCVITSSNNTDLSSNNGTGATDNTKWAPICTNATIPADGSQITLNFGTITNANTDNNTAEVITVEYKAVVLNIGSNNRSQTLGNSAVWTWTSGGSTPPKVNVTVVEPTLSIDKSTSFTSGDAGNTVPFTIVVANTGGTNYSDGHNVQFVDNLTTPKMTYVASSLSVGSCTGPAASGLTTNVDGTNKIITVGWDYFPVGASCTISFDATLDGSVTPGETLTNTGNLSWTSMPGDLTTAQSTYSTVSTERTGNTGNPGGAENDYRASDPYSVTINTPTPVKTLVSTSENSTASLDRVSIGEIVRYRLAVTIPEGTSSTFEIHDSLPDGMRFLNDNSTKVAFVANETGITSNVIATTDDASCLTGLNLSGNSATAPGCVLKASAITDNSGGTTFNDGSDVYFKLGTLVNSDSDPDAEYVVIEFNALVDNLLANQAATQLDNSFTVFVSGSQVGPASGTSSVVVAEPDLSITKTIITTPVDAGDDVVYEMVITNNSSGVNRATAYNAVVTDMLSSWLNLVNVSDVVVFGAPTGVNVDTSTSTTGAGGTVKVVIDKLPPAVDISSGATAVTLRVTAKVINTAEAGRTINNLAGLVYASLPGGVGTPKTDVVNNPTGSQTPGASGAADGARDGQNGVGAGLNNYAASANVSLTLNGPSMVKTVNPTQYTIGNTVSYTITVTLPEGVTKNLVVSDTLPTGLTYLGYDAADLVTTGFNGTVSIPTPPSAGSNPVVFTFSTDSTVTPDGNAANDSFKLIVRASVDDHASNISGATKTNTASASYQQNGSTTNLPNSSVNITLVEPVLTINKAFDKSLVKLGDTVTVTLEVENTGNSPAYQVVVRDPLPKTIFENIAAGTTPTGFTFSAVDNGANTDVTYTAQAGVSILTGPSNKLTFTFTAKIKNDASIATNYVNTAYVDKYVSHATGTIRTYPPISDTAPLDIEGADLAILKTAPASAKAGEQISYTLSVTNNGPNASPKVLVTDKILANQSFVSATGTGWTCTLNTLDPTVVECRMGTLASGATAPDITLTVNIDPAAANGTNLLNTAIVSSDGTIRDQVPTNNSSSTTVPLGTTADVSIMKNDGLDGGTYYAGQTFQYLLRVYNDGPSVAQNLTVTDTLDSRLTFVSFVPGDWTCSGPDGSNKITCTLPSMAVGGPSSIGVNVRIQANIGASTTIPNTAYVVSPTDPEDPFTNPETNNEASTSTPVEPAPVVQAVKTVVLKTDVNGDGIANPGDTLAYTVDITNTGASPALNVVFTDTPDVNTHLVNGTVATTLGTVTKGNTTGDADLSVNIGTIPALTGLVTVTFDVVINDPLPNGVTSINNQGVVNGSNLVAPVQTTANTNSQTPTQTTTPVLGQPKLSMDKAATLIQDLNNDGVVNPGDVLLYTVTIRNTGNGGDANVVFEDTPDPNTTLVAGSVITSQGTVVLGNNTNDAAVQVNIGLLAGGGGTATVTFRVMINNPFPVNVTQVSNQAVLSSSYYDGEITPHLPSNDPSTNPGGDPTVTPVVARPNVSVVKSAFLVIDADTSGSASPGDTLRYMITMTNNGNTDALALVLNDVPDKNTTLVVGSVKTTQGTVVTGNTAGDKTISVNIGTLAAGRSASVTIDVTINNPLPAETTQIVNQAFVTGSNQPQAPSDNPTTQTPNDPTTTVVTVPTAVTLTEVKTQVLDGLKVKITWVTAAEINNFGFNLYRAKVNDVTQAEKINSELIASKGGRGGAYEYVDVVSEARTWYYWLEDVDMNGIRTLHPAGVSTLNGGGHPVIPNGKLLYIPMIGQ